MIKKFLLIFYLILMCGVARAETLSIIDNIQKFPGVKQGVAFSIEDSKLNYLSTIDLVEFKGFNLEAGAAYDAEKTGVKAVAVVSYDLLKVKDIINFPVLNLIEFRPGVYVGAGRIEGASDGQIKCEGDWGVSLSVINVKF